ncbi:uncharacterized protein LOC135846286 isoform X2 [Planococcus citri]|uniref:uncharacterized protein LOC135846286 isoform X2 n=1 Tax=Planococcus citri TaxID=170843 RepID=UPI0031F989F2
MVIRVPLPTMLKIFKIQKGKFCGFECSLRTGAMIVLTTDLVVCEYLQSSKNSIFNVVFLIAGWSSLVAALCGAMKNQSLLLIPYVAVKLFYIMVFLLLTIISAQSVAVTGLVLFLGAFAIIAESISIVGLYGVMKEKPALQKPYVVVQMLYLLYLIVAFFVMPILFYTVDDLMGVRRTLGNAFGLVLILIESILGILVGVFYIKFIVVLSYYYKE